MSMWDRLDLGRPEQCWEWQGGRSKDGYGQMSVGGALQYVHRLVYAEVHGPIDDTDVVTHTCDNPPCANPRHLRLGTKRTNMLDMLRKGRAHEPKLTMEKARLIREAVARGVSQRQVATDYGISQRMVGHIVHHRQWREGTR